MTKPWKLLEANLIERGLPPSVARELIWQSLQTNDLHITDKASMVEDQSLSGEIPQEMLLDQIQQQFNQPLVVTSPVQAQEKGPSPTLLTFRLIIASASTSLSLISPYIDANGVKLLETPLIAAAGRGVQICLLTRETQRRQRSRTEGINALYRLGEKFIKVRDYHTQAQGHAHFTSVHAKLVMADNRLAYVGSAEIRGNALRKNYELGAILKNEEVSQIALSFQSVWEIARPVRLPVS